MNLLKYDKRPILPRHANKRYKSMGMTDVTTLLGGAQTPNADGTVGDGKYHLGDFSFLPQGTNLATSTAEGTLQNLLALGTPGGDGSPGANANTQVPYYVLVAEELTGKNYGTNYGDAYTAVYDAIKLAGRAPGGVKANIPAGQFDPNTHKIKPQTTLTGAAGSGDYGLSQMTASMQMGALDTLSGALRDWGLGKDSQYGDMTKWVYDKVMQPGNYKPAAQVIEELRNTPQYQARFPGMAYRAFFKQPPISENEYIGLESKYRETASQYLSDSDQSFITPNEIGILIGHNVSANEFNDRAINVYRVAKNALANDPETARQLQRMGVDTGHLAAYMFDPTKKYDDLLKTTQMGVIGGIASNTGFAENLGKGVLGTLATQQMTSPSNMDAAYFRNHFENIAGLKSLENSQVGQSGQATASKQQLLASEFSGLNQKFGTTVEQNAASIKRGIEARTAGLQGGGTFATTQKGVVGAGRASSEGTGQA